MRCRNGTRPFSVQPFWPSHDSIAGRNVSEPMTEIRTGGLRMDALSCSDPGDVPGSCADGSGGTVFDERQPSVFLFDPSYDAQRSWRGNLAWNGRLRDFRLRSEIVHSINLDQAGGIDRNFRGAEQFRLDDVMKFLAQNR